jgi:integrase
MKVTLRKKRLIDGRDSLYLDIYHDGKRQYEFLKLYLEKKNNSSNIRFSNKETLKFAETIRSERMIELASNEFGHENKNKQKVSFILYFEEASKDKPNYYSTLKHIRNYGYKDIRFKDIDKKWLEGFKDYLENDSLLHINSASFYFKKLKEVLYRASKDGYIKKSIIEDIGNVKTMEVKREYLTIDEVEKLAQTECTQQEIKRAFLFSCFTGFRQSDIRLLKWSDIKDGTIVIRQKKTNDYVNIPLGSTAKNLLYSCPKMKIESEFIFNIPKDRSTINRWLNRWFQLAELNKKAFYHMSRHTFATMNITMGTDLYTVGKLLGHKDIKTTQIYANLIDEKRQEAINKLPDIAISM